MTADWIYIIGMGNDEEEINDNAFTPVEIILAFIIPFILFWGGMLAPVLRIAFIFGASR